MTESELAKSIEDTIFKWSYATYSSNYDTYLQSIRGLVHSKLRSEARLGTILKWNASVNYDIVADMYIIVITYNDSMSMSNKHVKIQITNIAIKSAKERIISTGTHIDVNMWQKLDRILQQGKR
jgi:hypothetical protein